MRLSDSIIIEDVKRAISGMDLSAFRNSHVLLSGATGLLGAYFVYLFYYLNSLSYNIEADFITRHPVDKSSFLGEISQSKGFTFSARDLSEHVAYDKKYDFMIHAAGYGSPAKFIEDPIKTINVNYIGIKSMLESVQKNNSGCKVLYFSSSEIYGSPSPKDIPTPETFTGNSSVMSNRACYTESKRLSETLCLAYMSRFKTNVKIVRPALTYGPALTFLSGRVVAEFMKKAYLAKKIDMKDEGRDLRAFCYIGDALKQLIHILLFSKDTIYNVGSSREEVSIKDLAEKIGKMMDATVITGLGKDAAVAAAPSRVCLDMRKTENEFGIKPEVSLNIGLKRMLDWNLALIKEGTLKI